MTHAKRISTNVLKTTNYVMRTLRNVKIRMVHISVIARRAWEDTRTFVEVNAGD